MFCIHAFPIGQFGPVLSPVRGVARIMGGLVLAALVAAAPANASCEDPTMAIEDGFGANGPHEVTREEVANPAWKRRPVSLHVPQGNADKAFPVVFFAHGIGATNPLHYRQLVDHIASRGFAVVYAPYPTVAVAHERRYQALWEGFEAGLAALGPRADASRVGFVGHSYGGGATPFLAHRGLVGRGWGAAGAFLVVMAPWYVLGLEPEELATFPPHTRVAVQVYDRERINDHQIAIDLFDAITVPERQKLFVTLHSDEHGDCKVKAGHTTPATDGIRGHVDRLDHHGVFRVIDAVASDALLDDPEGRALAFGDGHDALARMGEWPDGTPVRPMTATRAPRAERPPDSFRFRAEAREFWIRAEALEF